MKGTTLVTGACGFLGGACIRRLVDRGEQVVAVVRDRHPRACLYADNLVDHCIEVRSDLSDFDRLISRYQPERVLHLAAQSQVPEANANPLDTYETNIGATWRLLEACRRARRTPERILVASTDKVYGASGAPYTEEMPLDPIHPYDVSKAAADLLARSYARHFELPVVLTRCANLYGPGDLNPDRLIPGVCMALVRGEPVRLRSKGQMSREWLHVDDAADATLMLLDGAGELPDLVYNVGSQQTATVREVVDTLLRISGRRSAVALPDRDPAGEIMMQSLDSSRLRALGWRSERELAEGLAETWRWYARWRWAPPPPPEATAS
jgi:CDP-glucose 4,6-dehydratase